MNQASHRQGLSWTAGRLDSKDLDCSCPSLCSWVLSGERLPLPPCWPSPFGCSSQHLPHLTFQVSTCARVDSPPGLRAPWCRDDYLSPLLPRLLGQCLAHCRCPLDNISSLLMASGVFHAFLHLPKRQNSQRNFLLKPKLVLSVRG